ncbi:MAG: phosphoesterase [Alphaproteobacteria bacterium CG11_big_fil_rev_8_21_14_0_20_39_49]|nr:MAG: phosphoesterase [Alphaproteobacteria bacterium CG11_big_fil_rev_8_21_14_0_20_39_49]
MKMTKYQILYLVIFSAIAALFLYYPQLDLYVSGLFFHEKVNMISDEPMVFGFFLGKNPVFAFLRESVKYVTICIAVFLFFMLGLNYLKKSDILGFTKKKIAYLILCLAVGPGLVVNAIFKDNWGRARPHQVENFSGKKEFTPPFIMTDQCERNCSFTSGDPSVGFFFFSFAFAFPKRRKQFAILATMLGSVYGVTRIVQGAHFLSDVIFSGLFVLGMCHVLHKLMFREEKENIEKTP